MGQDKALLEFDGQPLVEIAVGKLRVFCAEVSIAGNRDDLSLYAPVVPEQRSDAGPAAGVEAGLRASSQAWAMFIPVDVPLVPKELLTRWAQSVLRMSEDGLLVSHLRIIQNQPAFCMLRRECAEQFSSLLDRGERRLSMLFQLLASESEQGFAWVHDLSELYDKDCPSKETAQRWFMNLNTPAEFAEAARRRRARET